MADVASKTAGGNGDPDDRICQCLNALRRWCYPNQDSLVTAAIGY